MSTRKTPKRRKRFLAILATGMSVQKSCDAAGMPRSSAYTWRDSDPVFAAEWDAAVDAGTDRLEDEAWRRAHDGVDEPVFQGGKEVGAVRRYSDNILLRLLSARRPSQYRERQTIEHSGPDGAPMQHMTYTFPADVDAQGAVDFYKKILG
jgi:hypothetical protein